MSLGVLAPELRDQFGFSRAEIGLLTSFYAIGGALSSPVAGRLTDRFGPARVLGLSLLLMACATAGGALARSGLVLMAAAFVAGWGYGGMNPATNVIVAGRLGQRLGFFLSLKQTGVPIGGFVAGLVLPAVAIAYGWRWAFAVGALLTAGAACTAVLVRGAAVLGGGEAARGEPPAGPPAASSCQRGLGHRSYSGSPTPCAMPPALINRSRLPRPELGGSLAIPPGGSSIPLTSSG